MFYYATTRGLSFTYHALQHAQNDKSAELHVCFKRSYDAVLKHHHTFLIRSVVYVSTIILPISRDAGLFIYALLHSLLFSRHAIYESYPLP